MLRTVLVTVYCPLLTLAGVLIWSGCQPSGNTRTFSESDDVTHADDHAHDHAHGPHGGHVVELGGEDYHAEIAFDAATRKLTAYLLQSDLKTPLPAAAPHVSVRLKIGDATQELLLMPQPQAGDGEGKASVFSMTDATLPEAIKDAEDLQGDVVVDIDGTQYRGPITHDHDHAGHGHAH